MAAPRASCSKGFAVLHDRLVGFESVVTPSRRGPHNDPDIQREIYRIYATDVSNPTPRLMLKSDMELGYMTGVTVLKWQRS